MKYIVYILLSERDGGLHIDHATDLALAMAQHESGVKRETKYRLPVKLIHKESARSFKQVRMREQFWKSRKGQLELKGMFGKWFVGGI